MESHLARRYRSEKIFRTRGLASIVFGLLWVGFLFADIVGRGLGAFIAWEMRLEVRYDGEAMDIYDPMTMRNWPLPTTGSRCGAGSGRCFPMFRPAPSVPSCTDCSAMAPSWHCSNGCWLIRNCWVRAKSCGCRPRVGLGGFFPATWTAIR